MKNPISQIVKIIFLSLAGVMVCSKESNAQIVFEQSYAYSRSIANLEKEGSKYYLMDITASECRLYNLDYSLYKKIKLSVPSGKYLYDIQYVSQNLFDTDDGVELLYVFYQYVQTSTSYYYIYTTRIADEDGTVLLDLPGGSWTDIRNTGGSGSRMMNYITDYSIYPYPVETRIYRLPGQLSGVGSEVLPSSGEEHVFPNPTEGLIQLHPAGFDRYDRAEWVVVDAGGKYIARVPVQNPAVPLDLKSLGLVAGIYLVRLESKNYQTKFQQVVLNN